MSGLPRQMVFHRHPLHIPSFAMPAGASSSPTLIDSTRVPRGVRLCVSEGSQKGLNVSFPPRIRTKSILEAALSSMKQVELDRNTNT